MNLIIFPPQHALPLCSSTINQLWFSTVLLACCKNFAICCTLPLTRYLVSGILCQRAWMTDCCFRGQIWQYTTLTTKHGSGNGAEGMLPRTVHCLVKVQALHKLLTSCIRLTIIILWHDEYLGLGPAAAPSTTPPLPHREQTAWCQPLLLQSIIYVSAQTLSAGMRRYCLCHKLKA